MEKGAFINVHGPVNLEAAAAGRSVPFMACVLSTSSVPPMPQDIYYALQGACRADDASMLQFLLDYSQEQEMCFRMGDILHLALELGKRNAFSFLLRYLNGDLEGLNRSDGLYYAVKNADLQLVTALINLPNRACNVNAVVRNVVPRVNCSACSVLACAKDPVMIRLLLDAGAEVGPRSGCVTVMHAACTQYHVEGVRMLLEARAPAGRMGASEGALILTIRALCTEEQIPAKLAVLRLLLDAGGDNGQPGLGRFPPAHECVLAVGDIAKAAVLRLLLQRNPAIVRGESKGGSLTLMAAKQIEEEDVFAALADAGDDPNVPDNQGLRPLDLLLKTAPSLKDRDLPRRVRSIIPHLFRAGCDPLTLTRRKRTIVMDMVQMRTPNTDAIICSYITMTLDYILARTTTVAPKSH
jgi:ankyrin repeat protein